MIIIVLMMIMMMMIKAKILLRMNRHSKLNRIIKLNKLLLIMQMNYLIIMKIFKVENSIMNNSFFEIWLKFKILNLLKKFSQIFK